MPSNVGSPVGRPALQDYSNRQFPTKNDASPPTVKVKSAATGIGSAGVVDFENSVRAPSLPANRADDAPPFRREAPASDLSFFLPQPSHATAAGGADQPPGAPAVPPDPVDVLHDGATELFRRLDDAVNQGVIDDQEQPPSALPKLSKKRGGPSMAHWTVRAKHTNWDDPQSIKAKFPPWPDKSKYGQLQPPRFMFKRHRCHLAKARAVSAWRRLSTAQQKIMKAQFTQMAATEH